MLPKESQREFSPEHIRNQLLEIKWWNWSEEKIKKNKKFFTTDLSKAKDIHELIMG